MNQQEEKLFPGKGKTINNLSYGGQRTRATTQIVKAQQQTNNNNPIKNSIEEQKVQKQPMPGFGKKIGGQNNQNIKNGDWRCATCKFSNKGENESCGMCREAKNVLKEQQTPKINGQIQQRQTNQPAKRKENHAVKNQFQEEEKKQPPKPQAFSGNNVQTLSSQPNPQQRRGQSIQPGPARIMTLGQLNTQTTSGDLGAPKQQRFHKETTIQMLQNIAKNSDKLDQMPCVKGAQDMKKLKDRKFVQNLRDPAKFNMETFVREYGDVPK